MFKKPFDELVVKPIKNQRWKLLAPLQYRTKTGVFIHISSGFITDLASIPKALRLFYSVNGNHREAAVLHDWGYYKSGHVSKGVQFTRAQVDKLFLEAMKELGVGWFKRHSMYYAVRVGGWASWGNK